ncbi:DUF937 domain-containing protein [Deinococcus ruber]|uniref:Bacterial Ig-like domain-containing protein n=1 Tax=Deinococcus ruber TaxID=1848197 RepID=A0A918CMM7_9DEIO|nr:DUF937 domain-containing protein [Deinococcus ruber]GGR32962.1 hypothetical protein GCM10008957_49200 [Deinococcus ruber]
MELDERRYLQAHLNAPTIERLGAGLGLDAHQAQAVAAEILPAQLAVLTQLAGTHVGAQRLLDVAYNRVPLGPVDVITTTPADLSRLQEAGAALLPQLMGVAGDQDTQRIAASSGVPGATVRRMMELLLPLLLGLIAGRVTERGLTADTLGVLFGSAALVPAAPVSTVLSSTPQVIIKRGVPVTAHGIPPGPPMVPPAQEEEHHRGVGWWWLLPLLLVLLLGGCFLLQTRPAPLTLATPTTATQLPAGPVTLSGTGRAGETITVREHTTTITTTKVNPDGTYIASLPTPTAGEHPYTVAETGTDATVTQNVTVSAPAVIAPAPGSVPVPTTTLRTGTPGTPPTSASTPAVVTPVAVPTPTTPRTDTPSTPPPVTSTSMRPTLAFTAPAGGASLPTGSVVLHGTGPASTEISLVEDRTSLGQTRTDASGIWSFPVPSPAPGPHTYRASAGSVTRTLQVTVTAGTAHSGACTTPFSLSLKNGQTVKQPFRFGGTGVGNSYVVTVTRGARQIGHKTLPLNNACGWSYTSNPGQGRITYILREAGKSTVARRITLLVTR